MYGARADTSFEPESVKCDTLFVHFQENFGNDRVLLFANGVRVFDDTLYSSATQGLARVILLPFNADTIDFTFIFFERDRHWSLENDPLYFTSKKLEFEIVPSKQGRYLGLYVTWDLDKGSVYNKKSKRAINLFPGFIVSEKPFIYY